jgi:DNA-binding winged helix-turn-helix (wHTH) protein/tetratricopeptide (TPR) repeat protein
MDSAEKASPDQYGFGPFRLEVRERRLMRDGETLALQPKVFETLVFLVENAGRLMTKESLMAALWPDAVVEESNLTKNIWTIRRVLGESEGGGAYIETVPRVGYRFVAPVRIGPLDTPAAGMNSSAASAAPATPRHLRWRLLAALASAAVVAAVAIALARRGRQFPVLAVSRSKPAARRSIAVLGLRNLSGRAEADWLGTALSSMLSAELAAGEQLRIVPAENVARGHITLPPGAFSADTLSRLRTALDADEVATGSYVAIPAPGGEQLRVDVLVQDASTGEALASASETGSASDLFKLVSSAGRQLRARLGLAGPTSVEAASVRAALPTDPGATRLYAEGLARLRAGDTLRAKDLLVQATRTQPEFPLARAALSEAWSGLGYDGRAEEEARRAFELSGDLSREEKIETEARLAEAQKNWDRAAQLYGALRDFFPDNVEYSLKLATVETAGGKAGRALDIIDALRRTALSGRPDPRIDLAAADAFAALSQWEREIDTADQAARTAQARGLSDLVAQARLKSGSAHVLLGRSAEASDAFSEAAALFRKEGDRNGEAGAWINLANEASSRGEYTGALGLYRKAMATFRETGDRKGEAHALSDLAGMDWFLGNVAAAVKEGGDELAISREINDRRGTVWGLNALGNVLADQGQFDKAREMQQEALAISREMKDREYTAYGWSSLGDTALSLGDLAAALGNYKQALAISQELGDPVGISTQEEGIAAVLFAQGDLTRAEATYQRVLAGREKLGAKDTVAESRMLLAQVRIERGHAADGLALARQAGRVFESLHQTGNGAIALAVASQAELALGRRDAARRDAHRAVDVLGKNEQNGARFPVLLALARAEAASGHREAALSALAEARQRLATARWASFLLETDLVEAEVELDGGDAAGARKRLETLTAESRTRGFRLIAQKAEALAEGKPGANPFL